MSFSADTADPIRVGVVGVGNVATSFHLPILSAIDGVDIAFVADLDRERTTAFADIYEATAVTTGDPTDLPVCDAALLATPVGVREQYVTELGERDVALFSEKPFAPSFDDHCSFLNAVDVVACNYMRTTFSAVEQLATLLSTGVFGDLRSVRIARSIIGATGIDPEAYATDPEAAGGGILIERGCHDLSQLCQLFGGNALSVERAALVYNAGLDVDVAVEFAADRGDHTVPITYKFSMVEPLDLASTYEFEDATVTFDHTDAESSLTVTPRGETGSELGSLSFTPAPESAQTTREAMYRRWKAFLQGVRGDRTLDPEVETGLHVSRLITEIYENPDEEREVARCE